MHIEERYRLVNNFAFSMLNYGMVSMHKCSLLAVWLFDRMNHRFFLGEGQERSVTPRGEETFPV